MTGTMERIAPAVNGAGRKPVASVRHLANTPTEIPIHAERITRDWLRGVSERSLSATYHRTREAIEETVRGQVVAMLARKTAYAVGLALIGLVGVDAYQATVLDQGAAIERAFRRTRRGRGRREDDGLADSAAETELRVSDACGMVCAPVSEFAASWGSYASA